MDIRMETEIEIYKQSLFFPNGHFHVVVGYAAAFPGPTSQF